jgi:hypothetical protein
MTLCYAFASPNSAPSIFGSGKTVSYGTGGRSQEMKTILVIIKASCEGMRKITATKSIGT